MPPQFAKRLEAMVVKSGDKATMNVEINGTPEPKVEWYKDDTLLTNCPDTRIKSSGRKHTLVIPEAFPDDSGKYAGLFSSATSLQSTFMNLQPTFIVIDVFVV